MLLSPTARCNAVPGLEIETNDVKATHAASVSPIDDEKIFYMMARGISEPEAKRMVTLGFFDPLIVRMGSREMQAKVRYILESKWNGESTGKFDERALKDLMTEDAIKSGDVFEGHYKYRR
jgi:Fe-S cluster assembly scaffold protein SufB